MKTTYLGILIAFAFCVIMVACDDDSSPTDGTVVNKPYTVYTNSFESPLDTVGWNAWGWIELRSDTPLNGGAQSLFVSGGCIYPHAKYELEPLLEDSYLTIRCWGKTFGSGMVRLESQGLSGEFVSVQITDSAWTFYESSDTLFCPANQSVSLYLASGGIAADSMLVDMIEVVRVE